MLIASRFKRPTAPVNLPNGDGSSTDYFFRPVDPASPESEHVAEVTDPQHIQKLLCITEGYYVANAQHTFDAARAAVNAGAGGAAKPQPTKSAAPVAPPKAETPEKDPQPPPPPPQGEKTLVAPIAPVPNLEAAEKLLSITALKAIKAAIEAAPRPVLELALEIEVKKGADERANVTKAIRTKLGV